jgi:hypothetical protein
MKVAVKVTDCRNVDGFGVEASVTNPAVLPLAYLFTTWLSTFVVPDVKLASPEYCAVTGCVPTDRVEVVSVAVVPTIGEVPRDLVPSKNWNVPVAPAGAVAVNVTDCRNVDGFGVDASVNPFAVAGFTT